jgi:hypothetical protein
LKAVNDEKDKYVWSDFITPAIPIKPRGEGMVLSIARKTLNLGTLSWLDIFGFDGKEWKYLYRWIVADPGTADWLVLEHPILTHYVPEGITAFKLRLCGGYGANGVGVTWFDDLKVYQDGKLIYGNGFDNWNPYIGAGLGGVLTATPAYLITRKPEYALVGVIGALIGAGVGYATAKP